MPILNVLQSNFTFRLFAYLCFRKIYRTWNIEKKWIVE